VDTTVIVELRATLDRKEVPIPHEQHDTGYGVPAIPNLLSPEKRRAVSAPGVQQMPVVHLLLTEAMQWEHRILGLTVQAAKEPPEGAHGGRAQADPGYAQTEPQSGVMRVRCQLKDRGYTRHIASLYRVKRRIGLLIGQRTMAKKRYVPKPYQQMTWPGEHILIGERPKDCVNLQAVVK